MEPTRVAVVGCGAFGRHHARVYSQLPQARLVGVFDRDRERARAVAAEFGAPVLDSLAAVAGIAQAASVAVPTAAHAATALPLIEAGLDLLVEKPIAPDRAQADAMIAAAAGRGRILQVGHLERFNPAVRLLRPRLTRPLFFEVHRLSMFTPRSLDVDVLLDLMIHDLDIVLSFVGAPLSGLQAVGLPVLTPFVDIANVRLSFANGCVANLTASRVSTERVRKLRFFQPGEYISLDYGRRDVRIFSVAPGAARAAAESAATGLPPAAAPGIVQQHLTGADEEPLAQELIAFLDCVRERRPPEVGGEQARAALDAALQAADAIAQHTAQLGFPA